MKKLNPPSSWTAVARCGGLGEVAIKKKTPTGTTAGYFQTLGTTGFRVLDGFGSIFPFTIF